MSPRDAAATSPELGEHAGGPELITPLHAVIRRRVDPATLKQLERDGHLTAVRSAPGERERYDASEVRRVLGEGAES